EKAPREAEIPEEMPSERGCSGAILLKSADLLLGGSYSITEAIKKGLNKEDGEFPPLLAKTEGLIFKPLFKESEDGLKELSSLVGKKISFNSLMPYLNDLHGVTTIQPAILKEISSALQEIRCIKLVTSDGSNIYLDGQFHTVWSTPNIPFDFSATLCDVKSYINKYFFENHPFVLFMAPGYDAPTNEFFKLLLTLESTEKRIANIKIYGNKFEEFPEMSLSHAKRSPFIFGMWPWQFVEYRSVKKFGEYKPYHFASLDKDFYAADIEIELSQPNVSQAVTLRGYALKTNFSEKPRLLILCNLTGALDKPETIIDLYLSHWPNLEEGFQDFSRKIELFTYTGSSRQFFSTEMFNLNTADYQDVKSLFNLYLEALDLYVRWHFLPLGYEEREFSTVKEKFYSLKAAFKEEENCILVTFKPPQEFQFTKELSYACRRLNEREIKSQPEKKRFWFIICPIAKSEKV
ncbi:MAG: hypothetical protein ABH954_01580, partial [Candidatus Omnitrophota bacterium]